MQRVCNGSQTDPCLGSKTDVATSPPGGTQSDALDHLYDYLLGKDYIGVAFWQKHDEYAETAGSFYGLTSFNTTSGGSGNPNQLSITPAPQPPPIDASQLQWPSWYRLYIRTHPAPS